MKRPPTNSGLLRSKLDLVSGPRLEAHARLHAHPELPRLMPSLMVFLHQLMRASVPLLELGQQKALERAPVDPVCAGLVGYLGGHLEEERDHDVWMLEDLEACGISRAEVLARTPSPTVAGLVGAQYYWVQHHHPLALLGYLAALEGYPATEGLLDSLQARSGLPAAAWRTCRLHGQRDPGHRQALDALLDALPLRPEHQSLLGLSCMHTSMSIGLAIEELLAAVP